MKQAGYQDTKDLEAIQYNYIFNNSSNINIEKKTDTDIGENIDLKKTSSVQKAAKNVVKKYKMLQKPYSRPSPQAAVDVTDDEVSENEDTINELDPIANLQPVEMLKLPLKR